MFNSGVYFSLIEIIYAGFILLHTSKISNIFLRKHTRCTNIYSAHFEIHVNLNYRYSFSNSIILFMISLFNLLIQSQVRHWILWFRFLKKRSLNVNRTHKCSEYFQTYFKTVTNIWKVWMLEKTMILVVEKSVITECMIFYFLFGCLSFFI